MENLRLMVDGCGNGKTHGKGMNAAWQILRRFGRVTEARTRYRSKELAQGVGHSVPIGARIRSAEDYCINATVSMKSDPLKSLKSVVCSEPCSKNMEPSTVRLRLHLRLTQGDERSAADLAVVWPNGKRTDLFRLVWLYRQNLTLKPENTIED